MILRKGRDFMDMMDVALLSTSMANSQSLSQLGTVVLSKTLDTAREMAAGEVAMLDSMPRAAMETSVNPAVGSNFDVSI